jgi:uncharacterized C2H2 Zn-finger protein
MSSSRTKPYEGNPHTWEAILRKLLQIPMNQREYSWVEKHLKKFLDDLYKLFEEGKYIYKMGSIINLKYGGCNSIYDGQQRTLTMILILHVLGLVEKKLTNKIQNMLTVDIELDELTEQQQKIKDEYDVKIIPKIFCVNPNDMNALVDIFNGNVGLYIKYMCCYSQGGDDEDYTDEGDEDDEDVEEYKCNKCGVKAVRKMDFIRHLKNQHEFKECSGTSKLYNAFEYIYNYIIRRKYDESKTIQLYKFIVGEIDIQFYDCWDPEYVSRIFDWENNRGQDVATLDLIKNPLLVKIPDNKKFEVYDKWGTLKHTKNPIYKDYGQKVFDVAIQIFNNEIKRTINHEDLFRSIIESENTYNELQKFFDIVENLFSIMGSITTNKFGRLLNNSPRVQLNWEAYMWCLLPIFYKRGSVDERIIRLFCKWYFRKMGTSIYTFNNLCYSNEFIRITNCYLKDDTFDYYREIELCLQKNLDNSISLENYENTLTGLGFKSTNATHLLLFIETCENTDIVSVPLNYTLEHIFPQKNKDKLSNPSLIHRIGNLTLLEGKNSENGHKGNSSAGCKDHLTKVNSSYKDSSCKITRSIAFDYSTVFGEEEITIRSKQVAQLMNKYTLY